MSFVRKVPLPITALALGLAGLGNLLAAYSPLLKAACGVAAAAIVLLVLARIAFDTRAVLAELAQPPALAVFPTFFMAIMLLATYLKPLAAGPAKGVWAVALVLQLLLTGYFVIRAVPSSKLAQVLPGWFLVFVGFVVGSVTSPAFDAAPVGRALLYVGLAGYIGLLPVLAYRVARGPALPAPLVPTLAIFAAPPSLCLAGYLAVAPAKQPLVVYALLFLAAASVLYVLSLVPGVLRQGFVPSVAALTFPFVITATAVKQSHAFLATADAAIVLPAAAVTVMTLLAAVVVAYVLARYAVFLLVPAKPRPVPEPAAG